MQNNNNFNNNINNFNNNQTVDVLIYEPSIKDKINKFMDRDNELVIKTDKKIRSLMEDLPEIYAILEAKYLPIKTSSKMIGVVLKEYYNYVVKRINDFTKNLNRINNVLNDHILIKPKEARRFPEERFELIEKQHEIHKELDSLVDYYIEFFNNTKKLDPTKIKKLNVNDFEYAFSKKINLLYEKSKDCEKRIKEFIKKTNDFVETNNFFIPNNAIKNYVPEEKQKEYYDLLKNLLTYKNDLIEGYNFFEKGMKETDEFNKKKFEDLIKSVDAILEKTPYYFNLIEGEYTEEVKKELDEMENKINFYLDDNDMLKFIEYLKLSSLRVNCYGKSENKIFISYKPLFDMNETKKTKQKTLLNDELFSECKSYTERKNYFLNKKRKNLTFEESSYYNHFKYVKYYLDFVKECMNPDKLYVYNKELNMLQEGIDYAKESYNVLKKIEDCVTIKQIENYVNSMENEFLKNNIKDNIKERYDSFFENKKNFNNSEEENLIEILKEDLKFVLKSAMKYYKQFVIRNFRKFSKSIEYRKTDLYKSKKYTQTEIEEQNFNEINLHQAHHFMAKKGLYTKRPAGIMKKMFDLDDFLYASGITIEEYEEFKNSEFYDSKVIEKIKKLVELTETNKLSLDATIKLVKIIDLFKLDLEYFVNNINEIETNKETKNLNDNIIKNIDEASEEIIYLNKIVNREDPPEIKLRNEFNDIKEEVEEIFEDLDESIKNKI